MPKLQERINIDAGGPEAQVSSDMDSANSTGKAAADISNLIEASASEFSSVEQLKNLDRLVEESVAKVNQLVDSRLKDFQNGDEKSCYLAVNSELKKATSIAGQRKEMLNKISSISPPLLMKTSIPYWILELKTKWQLDQSFAPASILDQLIEFYKLELEAIIIEHHLLFVKWSKTCSSKLNASNPNYMKSVYTRFKKLQDSLREDYVDKLAKYRHLADGQFQRQEKKRLLKQEKEEWAQKFATYRESIHQQNVKPAAKAQEDAKANEAGSDAVGGDDNEDSIENQKKSWLLKWSAFLTDHETSAEQHNPADALAKSYSTKRNWSQYTNCPLNSDNISNWLQHAKDPRSTTLWKQLEKQSADFTAADVAALEKFLKKNFDSERLARCFMGQTQTLFENKGLNMCKDYLFLSSDSEMDPTLSVLMGYPGLGVVFNRLPSKLYSAIEFINDLKDLISAFEVNVSIDLEDGRPFSYACQQIFAKLFCKQANEWIFPPIDPERATKWIEQNSSKVIQAKDENASLDWTKQVRLKPFPKFLKGPAWNWWLQPALPDWLEAQKSQLYALDNPKWIDYELAFELDMLRSRDSHLVQIKLKESAANLQRLTCLSGREKQSFRHFSHPELGEANSGKGRAAENAIDSIRQKKRQIEVAERQFRASNRKDTVKGKSLFATAIANDLKSADDPEKVRDAKVSGSASTLDTDRISDTAYYKAAFNPDTLYTLDFFYEHEVFATSQLQFLFAQQQRWRLLHQLNYIHHLVLQVQLLQPNFHFHEELGDVSLEHTELDFEDVLQTGLSEESSSRKLQQPASASSRPLHLLVDKNATPFVYDEAVKALHEHEKELLIVGSAWILQEASIAFPSSNSSVLNRASQSNKSSKEHVQLSGKQQDNSANLRSKDESENLFDALGLESSTIPETAGASFASPHLSRSHIMSRLFACEVELQEQKIELLEILINLLEKAFDREQAEKLKGLIASIIKLRPFYAWQNDASFEKCFAIQTLSLRIKADLFKNIKIATFQNTGSNSAHVSDEFSIFSSQSINDLREEVCLSRPSLHGDSGALVVYLIEYVPHLENEIKLLLCGKRVAPNGDDNAGPSILKLSGNKLFIPPIARCVIWNFVNEQIKATYPFYPAQPQFPRLVTEEHLAKPADPAHQLVAEEEEYPKALYGAINSLWRTLSFQRLQSSHVQSFFLKSTVSKLLKNAKLYGRIPFDLLAENKLSCDENYLALLNLKSPATVEKSDAACDSNFDALLDPEDLSDFIYTDRNVDDKVPSNWAVTEILDEDVVSNLQPCQIARFEVLEFALWKVMLFQLHTKQILTWQESLANSAIPATIEEFHAFEELDAARENLAKRQQDQFKFNAANGKGEATQTASNNSSTGRIWLTDLFNPAQCKKLIFNIIRQALERVATLADQQAFQKALLNWTHDNSRVLSNKEKQALLLTYSSFLADLYTDTVSDIALQFLSASELVQQTRQQQLIIEDFAFSNMIFGKDAPRGGQITVNLQANSAYLDTVSKSSTVTGSSVVPKTQPSCVVPLFGARNWYALYDKYFQFSKQMELWPKIMSSKWSFKESGHIVTASLGQPEAARLATLQQLEMDMLLYVKRFALWLKPSKHVFGQMKAVRELDYILFEMQSCRNDLRRFGDALKYEQVIFNLKKKWKRQLLKTAAIASLGAYAAHVYDCKGDFNFRILRDNSLKQYKDFEENRAKSWKYLLCGANLQHDAGMSLSLANFRESMVDSCSNRTLKKHWFDAIFDLEEILECTDKSASAVSHDALTKPRTEDGGDAQKDQLELLGNICQLYNWRVCFLETRSDSKSFFKDYTNTILVHAVKVVCHIFHELPQSAGTNLLSHRNATLGQLVPKDWKASRETLIVLQKCELRLLQSTISVGITQRWKLQLDLIAELLEDEKNAKLFKKKPLLSLTNGTTMSEQEYKEKSLFFQRFLSIMFRNINNTTRALRPLLAQANELIRPEDQIVLSQYVIMPRNKLGEALLSLSQDLAKWRQPPVFDETHQKELSQDFLNRICSINSKLEQQLQFAEFDLARERQAGAQQLRIEAHQLAGNWCIEMSNLTNKVQELYRQKSADEKKIRRKIADEYDDLVAFLVQQNVEKDHSFEEFRINLLGRSRQVVLEVKRDQLKLASNAASALPISQLLQDESNVQEEKIELEQKVVDLKKILLKRQFFSKLKDASTEQYYQKQLSRVTADLANAEQKLWSSYRESEAHEEALRKQLAKVQKESNETFQELKQLRSRHSELVNVVKSLQQQPAKNSTAPSSKISPSTYTISSSLTDSSSMPQVENLLYQYQLQLGKFAEELEAKTNFIEEMIGEKKDWQKQQSAVLHQLGNLHQKLCTPIQLESTEALVPKTANVPDSGSLSVKQVLSMAMSAAEHFQNSRDREIRYLSKKCADLQERVKTYNKFDELGKADATDESYLAEENQAYDDKSYTFKGPKEHSTRTVNFQLPENFAEIKFPSRPPSHLSKNATSTTPPKQTAKLSLGAAINFSNASDLVEGTQVLHERPQTARISRSPTQQHITRPSSTFKRVL